MKGRNIILMIFYLQRMKLSDVSDSCRLEDIRKLTREGKCASISHRGSELLQWNECTEKLSKLYYRMRGKLCPFITSECFLWLRFSYF